MKKQIITILFLLVIFSSKTFAYSNNFLYMLEAIGAETTNINGLAVNEEVYNRYNLIVYGSPMTITSQNQRWKTTNNGKWTAEDHGWNGIGTRGEFAILGEDYLGKKVHNEKFPDDYTSGTSPEEWNYRVIKDAMDSWTNPNLYKDEMQREYMMNQKLSRFGETYNLTALNIGLDKTRVENYATWGNDGSIYTEKPGDGNIYWIATFSVPKMAGDAKLNSILELPLGNNYAISKEMEEIEVPLEFGAYVDGLSDYAKAEHVKIIEAELKVNGEKSSTVSNTKKIKTTKTGGILVNKNDYLGQDEIKIKLECTSFLSTFFENDPLLYSSKSQEITIKIEGEEKKKVKIINDEKAPNIYDIKIERVSKNDVVELYKVKKSNQKFICAGQVIKITVRTSLSASQVTFDFSGNTSITKLDELTKKFEWSEPKARGEETRFASFASLESAYSFPQRFSLDKKTTTSKTFSAVYVIPYGTAQTLYSWNSIREISKDAFKIDASKLFTQKEKPYTLVIKAKNSEGVRTKTTQLHVAERWDALYNRNIYEYIN